MVSPLFILCHMQGNSSLEQRWKLIKEAFEGKQISTSVELEKAILSYNSRYNNIWNFSRFHEFVDQVLFQFFNT